jgi:hypothetical protein
MQHRKILDDIYPLYRVWIAIVGVKEPGIVVPQKVSRRLFGP